MKIKKYKPPRSLVGEVLVHAICWTSALITAGCGIAIIIVLTFEL